jgi:alanine-alpha-ketoisovalerate/valine-pyruvate aminotransferase
MLRGEIGINITQMNISLKNTIHMNFYRAFKAAAGFDRECSRA